MTSPNSSTITPLQQTGNSLASQSSSTSTTSTSSQPQQAAAGRSFVGNNGIKRQNSTATAHNKTDSLSNGKVPFLPAVPSLGGHTTVNGNNAVSNTAASFDHNRKPSVTITAAGATGQLPNGGPMAGKPSMSNTMPVFGSMNSNSPSMVPSNLQSPGSLNPHLSNPRITSPQQSPSPIPQPSASGGKPPSSLQSSNNAVSFGNFGPEEPNRHSNPSISGLSSGSLTPNMGPVPLRRESSQQSNSENGIGMNGSRGGYHGSGRGRGGYQGHMHSPNPYSSNPSYRSVNNPRSAGANSQFPQGNRAFSYQGQGSQNRASPSIHYVQPVTPGQMGMVSPGMQGQQQYYQSNMGQPVNQPLSLQSSTAPKSQKNETSEAAAKLFSSAQLQYPIFSFQPAVVALPTTLSPESGQFEQFLTLRKQGFFTNQDGILYPAPYGQYGMGVQMPPQMQMGQSYYPGSPRPPQAMTPSQSQYMPSQYAPPSSSMSRSPSGIGERSNSVVSQPPSTPMTPSGHLNNPPTNRPSPAPKQSAFIVPKKTGGIKIVNPNTREELKIEKPPESPAIIPPSKSPATVSTNPTPPSRTPDSHTRTDSQSIKNQSDIAKKFKADIESKLNAEKAEAERLEAEKTKQQSEPEEEKQSEDEETEVVKPAEDVKDSKPDDDTKSTEPAKSEDVAVSSPPTQPIIVEPPKEDAKETERELTEDDDEYWAKIEAEELAREEAAERAYQEKKKTQDAEKAKKKAEEDAKRDEEFKRMEAEAEAAEEEKERKRKQGGTQREINPEFAALSKSSNAFKATESTAESSGATTPPSADESSSMPPPATKTAGSVKSKPVPLKLETSKQVEAPTPSAALQSLRSARFLTRIDDKIYPSAIASPNPALNSAAPMGKFRYDKNFLMQFQSVFTEKPSETWSDKIRETVGDSDTPQTAKGGRSHTIGAGSLHRGGSTPKSILGGPFANQGGGMGAFVRGSTSEQRFAASTKQLSNKQPYAMSHPTAFPGGFPGSSNMIRSASSTSIGHPQSPRNNPSRGGRGGSSRAGANPKVDAKANASMPLTAGKEVASLKVSESGWKPIHVGQGAAAGPPPGGETGYLAPDVVQRKVKSALNKMTPTTFEKITGQIIDIVMQSKQETDGRTLRQVIQLTFEKATDESHWAQMYAEFCSRMLHSMTPEIKDETLGLDKNGNVTAGNTLFRRYLLNRCQQDFEAGWKSKLPDLPASANGEAELLSDEYYAAAAAKRRGLGLVKFIGELYKLGMLTSRIMVMCVQRLLEYDGTPEEAEIESLSSLLNTIGEGLDNDEKAHTAMNAFFQRIGDILKIEALPSRMKFMLMDLVDLRKANWKGKQSAAKGPATIDQIHAQAAAAEREKETQRILDAQKSRGPGGGSGRLPMGRGDARFPGQMAPPPQSNSVGMDDLRRLGRQSSRQTSAAAGPVSFGPTSMFNTRGSNTSNKKTLGLFGRAGDDSNASSRTGTPPAQKKDEKDTKGSTNAFSALAALDPNEGADGPASPPSTAASPALSSVRPGIARNRSKSPLKDEDKGN